MPTLLLFAILAQSAVSETITVTATRTETRVADTPASVVVVTDDALRTSAAPAIDDALRQVAGFTLFRRAGSRVANPTTQGVTLRGVGASGASRALVLDDGVPLNDPFGGWVYWGRVPRASLEQVEVLRGGASDLYGSSAMGGVIQFIRRKSAGVHVDVSGGSDETGSATAFIGGQHFSIAADLFTTAGFVLVREQQRGAVDVAADSERATLDATARIERAFVRGSYYGESRNNGTPLQVNDTAIRHLSAGYTAGPLSLRAYANDQDYYQTFSAIAAGRASERLTVEQRVPSRGIGGSAQWTAAARGRHVLIVGAEARSARGTSEEVRFTAAGTFFANDGGKQQAAAAFVEDLFVVSPRTTLTAGLRADYWRNEGGGADTTEAQLNPRVSLLWRRNDALSFAASAYTAFRAPTLNELYRGFRVGNINTLPNAELTSENLTGFEFGARARHARVTLFWMSVSDAISNVTLSTGPTITRQRQNLGRTRSLGIEVDGEWQLARSLALSGGWLFVDATVRDGELRGRRVPQVARHQATAQLTWKEHCGAQLRWSARQFDDDRNELTLAGYFVADLFAAHPIARGVEATLAVENLFDEEVEVSATPVITRGQPRAWRIGLRYRR